jgi:hypothetical protein
MYTSQFEKIFKEHQGNIIHKWHHYFEIYDRHFQRFKNKKIVLLEIGVHKGGSLEMWKKYFGPECQFIGVDIHPLCKQFEDERTKIFIGSQDDREFLGRLKKEIPKVDILIDDGGHMMDQLKISFEELYDWVVDDGVYLAEDLHTCYWPAYEGGYKRKNSFIEFCKGLIDELNAWHSQQKKLKVSTFSRSTHSMHFYDSIVVFEKRKISKPFHLFAGKVDNENIQGPPPKISNWWRNLKNQIYHRTGIDL